MDILYASERNNQSIVTMKNDMPHAPFVLDDKATSITNITLLQ